MSHTRLIDRGAQFERCQATWCAAGCRARTGYSAAQVSRYERGVTPLTDVAVLRRFADALELPHRAFGLVASPPRPRARHGYRNGANAAFPRLPAHKVGWPGWEDGDDSVRRRRLLAGLAFTAAAAAGSPLIPGGSTQADDASLGDRLVGGLRDAMLGVGHTATASPVETLEADFSRALADFDRCRYASLAARLPRLIRAGHAISAESDEEGRCRLLAGSYLLATRVLVKLDERQLGWIAADRARQLSQAADSPLAVAESARQLAVLARKAGWNDQALSIALAAGDDPALRTMGRVGTAQRGLLIQSAAYTLARSGDRAGMRELTAEAAALAAGLGGLPLLRDHGGGFNPITVQLHLISAENSAGDPSAALAAARAVVPRVLPSVERRARYFIDIATAYGRWGRRDECIRALLAAEQHAPEEIHARPAVRSLISGLLISGRTTAELRGLAARSGVTG